MRSLFGRAGRAAAAAAGAFASSASRGSVAAVAGVVTAATAAAAATAGTAGSPRAPPATPAAQVAPIPCEDGTTVIPWSTPSRSEAVRRLRSERFDVVVVGGGCVGAGVAWEAATRGLSVALVERDDFAAGTSGRSTKLIHGGIRYLEAAVWGLDWELYTLVEEALAERAHLLNAAPFMSHPLPIIIPLYTWWEIPYMWVGTKMYDLLAGSKRAVPASYYLNREEALYQFPMLKAEGLTGGIVYFDGMHNDTRMNTLIALTACQHGAVVANHTEVTAVLHEGEGGAASGVAVCDRITGERYNIRAGGVINATGCFGDAMRQLDDASAKPLIMGAAGVHIILPDHFSPDNMGLIIPKTRDGRVLFFLPWEGMTICGTTDAPSAITPTPAPTEQDVRFIIEESNRFLNRKVTMADVKAAWSGIRPLIRDPSAKSTAQVSRKHVVEVSPTGMVSVLGGKWTTYRRMAQDAVEAWAKRNGRSLEPSRTSKIGRAHV